MDISGTDNIVYTTNPIIIIASRFLEMVRPKWPALSIDLSFRPDTMDFTGLDLETAVNKVRRISNEQRLELFFLQDDAMRAHREEFGYALTRSGDGPFALYIKSREHVQMKTDSIVDVRAAAESIDVVEPFPAWICSPSLREVSIVTPADPMTNLFSQWLLELTLKVCREPS
jgi:hypothetical protein